MPSSIYEYCIFTILDLNKLDEIFENGGTGSFTEGRIWKSAKEMEAAAEHAQKRLVVVFAAANNVDDLRYHATVTSIAFGSKPGETTISIKDLMLFRFPRPHKTELHLIKQGKNISEGHRRPYALCETPKVLLEGHQKDLPYLEKDAENDEREPLDATELLPHNVRANCYELLEDVIGVMPDSNEQHLDDLQHPSDPDLGWNEDNVFLLSTFLNAQYGLNVSEKAIGQCKKVGDFVALVKRTL